MNIGTNLFLVFVTFYLIGYVKLIFSKRERQSKVFTNTKLSKLRSVNVKSVEQQKEFLSTKFPKTDPFKWTWKNVGLFIWKIAWFIGILLIIKYLWATYIVYELQLWMTIVFAVVYPILSNIILKKFNLHGDDLSVYFK